MPRPELTLKQQADLDDSLLYAARRARERLAQLRAPRAGDSRT
jgi:hypothetical protein